MIVERIYFFVGGLGVAALIGLGLIIFEPQNEIQKTANATEDPAASILVQPKNETILRDENVTSTNAEVVRVVDGDTFIAKLDNEPSEWTVRMLGINSPETVDPRKPVECFGKEASSRLKEMLDGRRVRLEEDREADERDRYGRLLRNVFLSNGTDVNAMMVKDGYAHAYLSFPLNQERKNELHNLEKEAKFLEIGLWSPEVCKR